MPGMKFHVRCRQCGHLNRPDNNTRKGIRKTLIGEFTNCRGCGIEFSEIWVPARPLVLTIGKSLLDAGIRIYKTVHIHQYTKHVGRAPRAQAL